MNFECGLQTSDSNKNKYGIDVAEAQKLCNNSNLLKIPLKTTGK
jgi:uncharacterized DUF497 family protein